MQSLYLDMLLHDFLWDGKQGKIKRSDVRQGYEDGGFMMFDVTSFLSAPIISWLKRSLYANGKITKNLPSYVPFKKTWWWVCKYNYAKSKNKTKTSFWKDVFKHYKMFCWKCMPLTFNDFTSECVHHSVNICRGKRVIFKFFYQEMDWLWYYLSSAVNWPG